MADPGEGRRPLLARIPFAGAAAGAAVAAAGVWLVFGHALFAPPHGLASFALGSGLGLGLAGVAGGAVFGLGRLLHRGIAQVAAVGTGAGVLAGLLKLAVGAPAPSAFAVLVTAGAGLGAVAAWLGRRVGRGVAVALMLAAVAATVGLGRFLDRPPERASLSAEAADPGPFAIRRFHYGSGDDARRPEYGAAVDRVTRPVDATGLLPDWRGLRGWLRTRWWGFGPRRLPVNGRVWQPEGKGPFPLVLVAHGNHPMERFSDAGYAYLAEHLARRGFLVAAVDQNFLNRSHWADLLGAFEGEMEVRAGLLLEHLARFRAWNATPGDPLHGRVDLARMALVGHSRGGEAVALAAYRDRIPLEAPGGGARFPHGFGVRAVAALAPVGGHVHPLGERLVLEDLSYLVLHGSQDADLASFEGAVAFERVRFSGPGPAFKAALWIEGANHGQFNRDWGDTDLPAPLGRLVARAPLLAPREQERATEVLVGAFLEAVLGGNVRAARVFRDPRSAGLPVRYRAEYQGAGFQVLADFEEAGDAETASAPGARLEAGGLASWREGEVERRWVGSRGATRAVHLEWRRDPDAAPPYYALHLPPADAPLAAGAILSFSLADADYARVDRGDPTPPAIDLGIELEDAAGTRVRLPLRRFGELDPLYEEPVLRPELYDFRPEIVFRSFELPLADFHEVDPGFDPIRVRAIRFLFDESPRGLVALDDVGWRAVPPDPDAAPGAVR